LPLTEDKFPACDWNGLAAAEKHRGEVRVRIDGFLVAPAPQLPWVINIPAIIEAALALSLTPFQVFRYVILKPALRAVYPALGSQFILLLLTSSIVSSISANELTQAAQHIESKSFRSFEVYIVVTGLYLAMTMALSWLLKGVFRLSFRYPA
jgi:hypothetical protein